MKISRVEDDVIIVKLNPLEGLMLRLPWIGDWMARKIVRKVKRIAERVGKVVIIEWGG